MEGFTFYPGFECEEGPKASMRYKLRSVWVQAVVHFWSRTNWLAYSVVTELAQHGLSTLSWLHIREDTVFVNACVVYVCVCLWARVCTHEWRPEVGIRSFPQSFSVLVWRQRLSLNLELANSVRPLVKSPGILLCPPPQCWDDRWVQAYVWVLEWESGLQASTISWTLRINLLWRLPVSVE